MNARRTIPLMLLDWVAQGFPPTANGGRERSGSSRPSRFEEASYPAQQARLNRLHKSSVSWSGSARRASCTVGLAHRSERSEVCLCSKLSWLCL